MTEAVWVTQPHHPFSQALGYISPQLSPTVLLLVCLAKRVPSSVLGSREGRTPGAGVYLGWFLRSLAWRVLLLGVKFDPGMRKGKPNLFAERTKFQLLGLGWRLRRAQGLSICLRSSDNRLPGLIEH